MAANFRTIVDGVQILPKTTSTASVAGDIDFSTSTNKLNLHNGIVSSPIVTEASTGTITGKTISGLTNTITNVAYSSLVLTGSILNSDLAGGIDLTTKVTGALPIANGGTGQTTKSPAFNALSPMTTLGDLILGGTSGTGTRLPIGTNGFVLGSNGTTAVWTASGAGDMLLGGVQTVTGAKTFSDGTLKLAGATSGAATLKAPAVASTNIYTLPTLPGATSFLQIDSSGNLSGSIATLGALTTSNLSASANITGSQLAAAAGIVGTQLANATVNTAQITNAAITGPKIAASAVDTGNIVPLAITTGLIAVGAVSKTRLSAAVFGHSANVGLTCLNSTASIPVTIAGSGRPVLITINVYGTYDSPQIVTTHHTIRLKVNGSTLYTLYITPDNITDTNVYLNGTFIDPLGNNGSLTYDILTDTGTAGPPNGTIELICWEL